MDVNLVRNKSSQMLGINIKGRVIPLLPEKAFALSAEELRSPQVQSLLQSGLVKLEKAGKEPSGPSIPAIMMKSAKKEEEKRTDKKRGEH